MFVDDWLYPRKQSRCQDCLGFGLCTRFRSPAHYATIPLMSPTDTPTALATRNALGAASMSHFMAGKLLSFGSCLSVMFVHKP